MWRVLYIFVFLVMTGAAFGQESEITPCAEDYHTTLPTCCLKSDGLNYTLYRGSQVIQKFNYSRGANIHPGSDGAHDGVLATALKTLSLLKEAKSCN